MGPLYFENFTENIFLTNSVLKYEQEMFAKMSVINAKNEIIFELIETETDEVSKLILKKNKPVIDERMKSGSNDE